MAFVHSKKGVRLMIIIGKYKELCPSSKEYPSMKDFFEENDYSDKYKIIKYKQLK